MTSLDYATSLIVLLLFFFVPSVDSAPFRRQSSSTALYTHAPNVRDPTAEDDHSHTYNWPPEQDAMTLTHDGTRKELYDMNKVLKNNPTLEGWQIEAIQKWWNGHQDHVRFHCRNENDQLHPQMSERLEGFPIDPLKQDHADIYKSLDDLSSLIASLEPNGRDQLLTEWCVYMELLLEHFQREEEHGVHSTRRAFSAKEWAPIIKQFFDMGAKEEFGSLIHAMGPEEFRNTFMKQRKIPGFVWRLAFSKTLKYYETSMWQYMDALLCGVPPKST
jgi:hemerythrin-like domain-containing protein